MSSFSFAAIEDESRTIVGHSDNHQKIYDSSHIKGIRFISGDLCKSGPSLFASEKRFAPNFAHETIFGSKIIN